MSTFVPQLKRENAFLGDPLKDNFCAICNHDEGADSWCNVTCHCSRKIKYAHRNCLLSMSTCIRCNSSFVKIPERPSSKKPTPTMRQCYLKYTLILFALLYMILLAYDLMNCTSIQTIYAHELPETDIVDRPDYIKFPKIHMKCLRRGISYSIYHHLFNYYFFVFICLFVIYYMRI
ncbi:hypothetical protein BCV72DRAFT_60855 [Rhizopus microsporus var. microsporus]|uniref:RING-CH-type domain-containing protein n=1 Tax=Rhizopus microsporus var. microsporus TaxID=86635 RepID=A0A1X0QQG9_RHIZD|nr:hypothetical protein BCV72DRAFT_60855 [Rhizopus microsporus var. microsporus]